MGYHCPSAYNPAEFFIKTLAIIPDCEENCKATVRRICENFAVSEYAKQIEVVVQYEFHLGENEGVSYNFCCVGYIGNKILVFRGQSLLQQLVSFVIKGTSEFLSNATFPVNPNLGGRNFIG